MQQQDREALRTLRKNIFLTAYAGGIGHLGSAYSIVEILYALYGKKQMRFNAADPAWEGRDRLILSKGHGSLALYGMLAMAGYFSEETLWTFTRPGTILGGEPNVVEAPGVDATTGSLGHGLSIGVGMALSFQLDHKPNRVYVIVGDGECQEGSIWEAAQAAARFGLGNLTVILDDNRLQKMCPTEEVMGPVDWSKRWQSFGFAVTEIDGHNLDDICKSLDWAKQRPEQPQLILAHTVKGKGVSFMENGPQWHFRMPNRRELKKVTEELGITEEELIRCKEHSSTQSPN